MKKQGVILIGPILAGKTTVGKRLAEQLNLPFYDLEREAQPYQDAVGFEVSKLYDIYRDEGYTAVIRYRMPYRLAVLERALADFGAAVIELRDLDVAQAGETAVLRLQKALEPYHVVMLQPSPDIAKSVAVLTERDKVIYEGMEMNEFFLRHPSNRRLAKHIVYTEGKTPAETCAEILQQCQPEQKQVILIGPIGTGKTTQGKLVADALGLPQLTLDKERWAYYAEVGHDSAEQKRIMAEEGFAGVLRYWKRFDVHAVRRVLGDHPEGVFDFGAGQSVYENEADFETIAAFLRPFANIFLILPTPDDDRSVEILAQRTVERVYIDGLPRAEFMMTHPALAGVVDTAVFTDGKDPDETAREIGLSCKIRPFR